jgi:hypothetical protein
MIVGIPYMLLVDMKFRRHLLRLTNNTRVTQLDVKGFYYGPQLDSDN